MKIAGAFLLIDIVGGNTTPGDSLQRKDVARVFSEGIPMATPAMLAASPGIPAELKIVTTKLENGTTPDMESSGGRGGGAAL